MEKKGNGEREKEIKTENPFNSGRAFNLRFKVRFGMRNFNVDAVQGDVLYQIFFRNSIEFVPFNLDNRRNR